MKFLLIFILLFNLPFAIGFYETKDYAIFEDYDYAINYINNDIKAFHGVKTLPKNHPTKISLSEINVISSEVHQMYLRFFGLNEVDFPKPLIILAEKADSNNFAYVKNNKPIPSNLISLGVEHTVNDQVVYAVLAHEMAHYYHKHLKDQAGKFIKVSYHDDRTHISEHNAYGFKITDNPRLRAKLEMLDMMDATLYQGRGNIKKLSTIEITKSDPAYLLIQQKYPELFDGNLKRKDGCLPLIGYLKFLLKSKDLTVEMINKTQSYEVICENTKNKSWDFINKDFLARHDFTYLEDVPESYLTHPNPIVAESAQAIISNILPITSTLRVIYRQRTHLKNLVGTIEWDRLQFYSTETQADMTSFKILNEMRKAHYQLSVLNLQPKIFAACLYAIKDDKIAIPYLNHRKKYDNHGSECFRAYRTITLIDTYSPYLNKNVKLSNLIHDK